MGMVFHIVITYNTLRFSLTFLDSAFAVGTRIRLDFVIREV